MYTETTSRQKLPRRIKPGRTVGKKPELIPNANFESRMNVIRTVAMCSVVWGHCLVGLGNITFSGLGDRIIQASFLQAGRIGTILFFMISGFLIADKLDRFTLIGYIRYRLRSVILPWIFFVSLIVCIQLINSTSTHDVLTGRKLHLAILTFNFFKGAIFHAAYWFIPVAILSCMILIHFKKYVYKTGFGFILALITIFYSANLYLKWIPDNHTEAFLGYIFFMWLGIQVKRYSLAIRNILNVLPWRLLIPIVAFSFYLAFREGIILSAWHSDDAYASIRLSNIVLSLLIFFSLIKTFRLTGVQFFKPREYAYGIYLIHTIVIMVFTPTVDHAISKFHLNELMPQIIFVRLVLFVFVILISYLAVSVIKRSALCFVIGENSYRV